MYEYECDDCGHRFELIRKFSDEPVTACVSCGGKVRKLFSSPAIKFKGSGFYINDYARKPEGAQAESSKKDDKKNDDQSTKTSKKEKDGSSSKKETSESSPKSTSSSASSSKAERSRGGSSKG
jgi:putative FmdB family regulatory protein